MQTAGIFVGPLVELSARMQVGEYQLHRRNLELGMGIHRDTAAVVLDRDRAIDMHGDLDVLAVPGQMLVDRVVQDLENAVMETPLIRVADIHPRALPDRLQPSNLSILTRRTSRKRRLFPSQLASVEDAETDFPDNRKITLLIFK